MIKIPDWIALPVGLVLVTPIWLRVVIGIGLGIGIGAAVL